MISFFVCLIISVLLAISLGIAFVEKGNQWPLKRYRIYFQLFLRKYIHYKACQVFYCVPCCSFWMSLISDIIILLLNLFLYGSFYFFWPLSGFISLSISWIIMEYLNAIDKEQNINVFIDKGEENEK
jgi:hypothetical protein